MVYERIPNEDQLLHTNGADQVKHRAVDAAKDLWLGSQRDLHLIYTWSAPLSTKWYFMWHAYTVHKQVLEILSASYKSNSKMHLKVKNSLQISLTPCIWNVWKTILIKMMMTMMTIEVICDAVGGDGQLPWESSLQTKCGPSVDQVEKRQGVAQPGPAPRLVSTWSAPGLHLIHLVCIHQLVFNCHAHPMQIINCTSNVRSVFLRYQFAKCTWPFMQN